MIPAPHIYEVRPRKDHLGVDLISDAPPFGRLWYDTPDNAVGYAMRRSRSDDAVIRLRFYLNLGIYEARTQLPFDSHINAGVADRECRRAARS
jgi:hypothetical protein